MLVKATSQRKRTLHVTPRETYHSFSVSDHDNDDKFDFKMDGDPLGGQETVTIDGSVSWATTQSERWFTCDSLWAKFGGLKTMGAGGNWKDYDGIGFSDETASSPYQYCYVTFTEFHVKQSC